MGDLSLSRKDFLSLLITWFRRSIWFLAFAGAYTTSPPLLAVAVSINLRIFIDFEQVLRSFQLVLGLAFQLALNMDQASEYMNSAMYSWNRKTSQILQNPVGELKNVFGYTEPNYIYSNNPYLNYYDYYQR